MLSAISVQWLKGVYEIAMFSCEVTKEHLIQMDN